MSEEEFVYRRELFDTSNVEANKSKAPCKSRVTGQPTGTEIFDAFKNSLRYTWTVPSGSTNTHLTNEPNCRIHSRFQKYFCLNCLRLLCQQCYETTVFEHKVHETTKLMGEAQLLLRKNNTEINQTVETLRKVIRATQMKIKTTKFFDRHRISMVLMRRSNYNEDQFQQIWINEMNRLDNTKRMQQQHLDELIHLENYFTRILKRGDHFWRCLEGIMLPEFQENVRKLLDRHNEISPLPANSLLIGLTLKVKPRKGVHKIIRGKNKEEQLNRPWGVCCNKEGEIFVADRSNHQIKVFNRIGKLIDTIGSRGNGPLQFETPAGIAIHANENIVVVDKGNNRVQMITRDGKLVRIFGEDLDYPMDVACNCLGEIVVTNEKTNCVHMYSTYGQLLQKSPKELLWPNSMTYDSRRKITPRGVCFTPDRQIAITDFIRNSIIVLDRGLARVIYEIRPTRPTDRVEKLQSIACDQFCNFVTVDKQNSVYIFSFDGKKRVSFGSTGTGESEFQNPTGVCILPDSSICVSESANNRIHIIN